MGKMKESGEGKKNTRKVTITIRILNFPVISGYGTYVKSNGQKEKPQ